MQLCERSAHRSSCCSEEDYEAFFNTRSVEENISRIKTPETPSSRERTYVGKMLRVWLIRMLGHFSERHLYFTSRGYLFRDRASGN